MQKDDVIYRQAAIDAKQEFRNPNVVRSTEARTAYDRTYANGWNDCNSAWIDVVKDLPSAQPELRWIPVTERLPKEKINPNTQDYDWVLCSTTFGDVRAYHFGRGRFLHGCGDVTQYVTAWCELPEPYKEDPCNGCGYLGESCVGEGCGKLAERKKGEA